MRFFYSFCQKWQYTYISNSWNEKTIDFSQRHSDLIKKLHKKKFFVFLQNTETHNNLVREIIEKDKKEPTKPK